MNCMTIKPGAECSFMAKKGCTFPNQHCESAVEACSGCDRLVEWKDGLFCSSVPNPKAKWRSGLCNMASHAKEIIVIDERKLNPIKQSKRGKHK